MKGIWLKTSLGKVHFDMRDDWEDTPENREQLLKCFEESVKDIKNRK
jgi:frataxin-like iron-binding protein CyaY